MKKRIEFCKETEFSEQMLDSLMMSDQRGSETDMERIWFKEQLV